MLSEGMKLMPIFESSLVGGDVKTATAYHSNYTSCYLCTVGSNKLRFRSIERLEEVVMAVVFSGNFLIHVVYLHTAPCVNKHIK